MFTRRRGAGGRRRAGGDGGLGGGGNQDGRGCRAPGRAQGGGQRVARGVWWGFEEGRRGFRCRGAAKCAPGAPSHVVLLVQRSGLPGFVEAGGGRGRRSRLTARSRARPHARPVAALHLVVVGFDEVHHAPGAARDDEHDRGRAGIRIKLVPRGKLRCFATRNRFFAKKGTAAAALLCCRSIASRPAAPPQPRRHAPPPAARAGAVLLFVPQREIVPITKSTP